MKKLIILFSGAVGLLYGVFVMISYLMIAMHYERFGIDIAQWTTDWNEWITMSFSGIIGFMFMTFIILILCGLIVLFERFILVIAKINKDRSKKRVVLIGYPLLLLIAPAVYFFKGTTPVPLGASYQLESMLIVGLSELFALSLCARHFGFDINGSLSSVFKKHHVLLGIFGLLIFSYPIVFVAQRTDDLKNSPTLTTVYYKAQVKDSLMYLGSTRTHYFLYDSKTITSFALHRDSTRLEIHSINGTFLVNTLYLEADTLIKMQKLPGK